MTSSTLLSRSNLAKSDAAKSPMDLPTLSETADHLRKFAARMQANDAAAALQAANAACFASPAVPEVHYAYGQAWLAVGEPARAERAFAAALQLAPDCADSWVGYGVAKYRQSAIGPAIKAMRQALVRQPGHLAATTNLGTFLRLIGQVEAAESLLSRSLAQAPDDIAAQLNRAVELLADGEGEQAFAVLDVAPPADVRARRHWHLQRASALLQQRDVDAARAELAALAALGPMPDEIAPLWHWRAILLHLLDNDQPAARAAADTMAASLASMGPKAEPEHHIQAHYDLARFWQFEGEPDRTFAHWRAGHELLRRFQPFSRDKHLGFIEANIDSFGAGRFAHAAGQVATSDPTPVFIVGMPRSGTTLCEQILAAHGQAHGAGERAALAHTFVALGGGEMAEAVASVRGVAACTEGEIAAAGGRYLVDLRALAPDRQRIVDKMPGNYRYLGLVGRMLPGARIIHCVRDPRDIGLSIFGFRFYGYHDYAHDLADLGWTIVQSGRLMAHWRAVLPNPILTVRLADWVQDFAGTLARVLDHVGLPHDPNCERFYENTGRVLTGSRQQVRQPVNARGIGRWRAYAAQLTPLINELEAGGALAEWHDQAPPRANISP